MNKNLKKKIEKEKCLLRGFYVQHARRYLMIIISERQTN